MATISKYQTASGATLYRVRYRTPENRQTDKRGFITKRDAERFAATVEVAKMRGEYVAPSLGRVTVGELGPAWLDRQQGHMKPCGFRSYESAWRVHVEPRWGGTGCRRHPVHRRAGVGGELAGRRGPVIVQTAHSVLARILDDAVRDRLLAANPARGVEAAAAGQAAEHLPDRRPAACAGRRGRRYRSLVLLLGTAGLRWGEAAALRVSRRRLPAPPDRAAPQRGDGGPARPSSARSRAGRPAPCRWPGSSSTSWPPPVGARAATS